MFLLVSLPIYHVSIKTTIRGAICLLVNYITGKYVVLSRRNKSCVLGMACLYIVIHHAYAIRFWCVVCVGLISMGKVGTNRVTNGLLYD